MFTPCPRRPNLPSGGALFAKDLEVALSLQGRKVNIGHDPDGDIVERELAAHSYFSGFLIEVRVGQIAARFIQGDAELGASSGLGKFDQDVPAIEHFLEQLDGPLGAQADLNGV